MKANRTCTIDDCNSDHYGKGYCRKHHWRYKTHGDPLKVKQIKTHCDVKGCSNVHSTKGYCAMHYERNKRQGDPLIVTHIRDGRSRHPLYDRYMNMIDRCNNPDSNSYHCYGARGISVCDGWAKEIDGMYQPEGFWNYVEYIETLPKPSDDHRSIDRIDNDGNYQPGNVQWATDKMQCSNKQK